MLFSGLSNGSHTVTIGYDILHNGKHAIDYLGSYNATETTANPCVGVSGCSGSPTSTFTIPTDNITVTNNLNPYTNAPIVQTPGVFSLWGGTITGVTYEPYGNGDERRITVTFTSTVANPVLAWGGHIAWGGDWGIGNSAGGISGSPYHMRLIDLDGRGGNQDRSLSADAVIVAGVVNIVKQVSTFNGGNSSTQAFSFTASASFNPLTFSLVDNNVSGPDTKQSVAITTFPTLITVTEANTPGWTLADITCVDPTNDSSGNVITSTATIVVNGPEAVTCTFSNSQLVPSAGPVSVEGRVTDAYGRPIRGAVLTLIRTSDNSVRYTYTNTFGFYRFDEVPGGDFYLISVRAGKYNFENNTVGFSLEDNATGIDFQASF